MEPLQRPVFRTAASSGRPSFAASEINEYATTSFARQVDSTIISTFVTATVYEELMWFRTTDGIPVLRIQKQGTASTVYYAGIPGGNAVHRRASNVASGLVVREGSLSLRSGEPLTSVRLIDATGRLVLSAQAAGSSMSLAGIPKGVFLARIVRGDGAALEETIAIP